MIEIHDILKKDYKKARQFAIDGMHLNWYMNSKLVLDLYARYFWNMEMNRATKVYGAYVGDAFVGVLLADMKGEPKRQQSILKQMYVKMFDWLQHLVTWKGVGAYCSTCLYGLHGDRDLLFQKQHPCPDGKEGTVASTHGLWPQYLPLCCAAGGYQSDYKRNDLFGRSDRILL